VIRQRRRRNGGPISRPVRPSAAAERRTPDQTKGFYPTPSRKGNGPAIVPELKAGRALLHRHGQHCAPTWVIRQRRRRNGGPISRPVRPSAAAERRTPDQTLKAGRALLHRHGQHCALHEGVRFSLSACPKAPFVSDRARGSREPDLGDQAKTTSERRTHFSPCSTVRSSPN
jgi:hypothetical protein